MFFCNFQLVTKPNLIQGNDSWPEPCQRDEKTYEQARNAHVKKNTSSGKICAKCYGILSQKWGMLQLSAFIVIFQAFYDYLWHRMVLF